jgi:hypothetical protein
MKIRPGGAEMNGAWRLVSRTLYTTVHFLKNVLWHGSMIMYVLYCFVR